VTPKLPFVDLKAQHTSIAAEVEAAIQRVVTNADFILGADVAAFEDEFATYCEATQAVGLDSGMSALELGMRALGIGPGDEVITPAGSFIASSSAISFTGATPVWVDVDAKTYNIDPDLLEAAITNRTRAIMAVHLYGQPADMDRIIEIGDRHGLFSSRTLASRTERATREGGPARLGHLPRSASTRARTSARTATQER
jgi:dTDP-4-amino-4,6-dideoxygalactose transaminase